MIAANRSGIPTKLMKQALGVLSLHKTLLSSQKEFQQGGHVAICVFKLYKTFLYSQREHLL